MGEEKFDVIIVGGGLAGLTAAYLLAKEGLEVILIERGSFCGAKNVTGGRLYGHSLEKVIPGFAEEAPVERKITKERISLLTKDGGTTIEYSSDKLGFHPSYSVQRGKFDKWLADKAESAGAMIVPGIRVDDVIKEDGKVVGIVAGEEVMKADVVLLADGVNSLLAQKLGMKKELGSHQVAVGVKEVISLDEKTIADRFGCNAGEGVAWMFIGYPTGGNVGGGFLYANKESISLGAVTTVGDIGHSEVSVPDMMDRMKEHPLIKPLIAGGKTVEYAAHLVPEGGYDMIPTLYDNGVLVAGDAAALVINVGYTVRGMDLAIESGRLAAETILMAKEKGDFSAETLSAYQEALEDSFVFQDMKHYKKFPEFMESSHRMFEQYPTLLDDIFSKLFVISGSNPMKVQDIALNAVKKIGLVNLAKDGIKAMGAL